MSSDIKKVILYTGSCEIEREITVPASAGLTEFFYPGLLTEEVVYFESNDAEVCEVKTKRALLEGIEEHKAPLVDKLNETKKRIMDLSKEMARLQLGRDITLKNSDFEAETVEEFETLYTYFLAKLDQILSELTEKQHESDDLKRLVPILEAQIKKVDVMRDCLCITVRSAEEKDVKVKLITKTTSAFFSPSYRVDVGDVCAFRLVADVVNNTGVNWEDVELELCTAPNEFTHVPEFYPEQIGMERVMRARMAAPMAMNVMAEDMCCEAESAPVSVNSVTSRDFSIEKYSLKDSGTDKITLEEEELSFKLECTVFGFSRAKAQIVATCDYAPGIEANADVYYYGKKVSSTYLTSTTDELQISLGVDKLIAVTKKSLVPFTGGVLNKKTEKGYSIIVKNNRDTKTEVYIVDRIPVSVNKTVIVEPTDLSGATVSENGRLDWKIVLKPGETKEVKVKYLIKK